jgi:dienelactone hydrolase
MAMPSPSARAGFLPLMERGPAEGTAAVRAYGVLSDRIYRTLADHAYPLDVYRPPAAEKAAALPAVVVVHGQAHPALLRDAKSWPALQRLARTLAGRDVVAVVPNLGASASGPEPWRQYSNVGLVADNVVAAVRHVRAHAVALGVDRRRIGLWVAAEGGLYALGPALGGELESAVRCAVAVHPRLWDARLGLTRPALDGGVLERLRAADHVRRRPAFPVLIVRAALDAAEVNGPIDAFAQLATEAHAPVTVVRHPGGHHAFDGVEATDETAAALERALAFLERNL